MERMRNIPHENDKNNVFAAKRFLRILQLILSFQGVNLVSM